MRNTYNGWKLNGRQVQQGERGLYRNEYGDYIYDISQTKPRAYKKTVIYRDRYGRVIQKETQYY